MQPAFASAPGGALARFSIGGAEIVKVRGAEQPGFLLQIDGVGALLVAAPVEIAALGATARVARGARVELPHGALCLGARGLVDQRRAGQRGTRGSARGGIAIFARHELQCARGREIAPQPFSQRPRVAGIAAGDRCSQVRYASPDVALGVALAQAWRS